VLVRRPWSPLTRPSAAASPYSISRTLALLARIVGRGSGLYQRSCKNAERVECAGVELKLGSFRKDAKAIIVAYASYCGKRLACSSLGSTVATAMATSDLYELASA
jgi:hypothetical protein